jgi:peptidoglycan/xylan/chitin deacetylase (PgdA/CDA1 family)
MLGEEDPCMISLFHHTEDGCSLNGIRHFIETSGIPISVNQDSQSGVCILYGEGRRGDFSLCIQNNDLQSRVHGVVRAFGIEAPIFETPNNTGEGGKIFGFFEKDGEKFPCITFTQNTITIGFDIFREIGYLLSGHIESIRNDLSQAEEIRIPEPPIIDIYEDILFRSILIGCNNIGIPLIRKSYWPDGKKFAVCLTHDVDELKKTYQWVTRPLRYLIKGDLQGMTNQAFSFLLKMRGIEPYWTFDEIIRINKELSVTSTFFFLKESARIELLSPNTWHHSGRCRDLSSPDAIDVIQKIASEGNEIGLHGSYYSYNDPDLLLSEKEELERVSGREIVGIRQHHLNLEIPNTWKHQEEAGLLYDTSLGFKDRAGFRFGTCFPVHPVSGDSPLKILEIPLAIMDITLHGRSDRCEECKRIIDVVERYQGVLTLLWHPPVFNALEYPGDSKIYQDVIELCKQRGAWVTSAGEVARWWKTRAENTAEYVLEDDTLRITTISGNQQFFDLYLPENREIIKVSEKVDIIGRNGACIHLRKLDKIETEEVLVMM